jgi:hypothetical protein
MTLAESTVISNDQGNIEHISFFVCAICSKKLYPGQHR